MAELAFIEHRMAGDPTNRRVANHAAVLAMLRSSGLRLLGCPTAEIYIAEPDGFPGWPADFISVQLNDIFGPE